MNLKPGLTVNNRFFENPVIAFERDERNYKEVPTDGSDVVDFYNGKKIFLTGGTGFLGKLITEKLLRLCPQTQIYMLCRPKKGNDMKTRLDEIYNDQLFSKLDKIDPNFRNRVIPISGDISSLELGISKEDRAIITANAEIIIHSAASVRFNDSLENLVRTNVRGTKLMVELAKECKKLLIFAHISTAYTHLEHQPVEEKFYDISVSPYELIDMVNANDKEKLREFKKQTAKEVISYYTYTKATTERLIEIECQDMPTVMFRPGVVTPTYEGPLQGWIDNIYGPTGVVVGSALGIMRVLYADKEAFANIVPGDYTINSLLVAIYRRHADRTNKIAIYNYVSTSENPFTWKEFEHNTKWYGVQLGSLKAIWCYSLSLCKYKITYFIMSFFLHLIPGLLVDGATLLMGQKPRLLKIYKKVYEFSDAIAPFSLGDHKFSNDHVQELWTRTSLVDRKLFPFDIKQVDWAKYCQRSVLGLRLYLIKEPLDTLEQSKTRYRRFYLIHNILYYLGIALGLRILYGILRLVFGF